MAISRKIPRTDRQSHRLNVPSFLGDFSSYPKESPSAVPLGFNRGSALLPGLSCLTDRESVGQSLSALCTSSLENIATVSGLHSFSEAMLLLSLTLLRLVGSEHFGYLLQDLLSGRNSAGLTGAEIPCENTERATLTVIL